MLKKLRKNKKGFTLAELLIVVAIIGVLVAVSIPIFTAQLAKARLATNQANARAAVAEATAEYLTAADGTVYITETYTSDSGTGTCTPATTGDTPTSATAGNITPVTIADWTKTTTVGSGTDNLGSKTYGTWTVIVDSTGVKAIGAAE